MGCLQDQVASRVNEPALGLRELTPEHKDQMLPPLAEPEDNGFGQPLPSKASMGAGVTRLDGQVGVEQQYLEFKISIRCA